MNKYIIILLISLLISCEESEPDLFVDPELQQYFDLFAQEAASRGIEVDFVAAEIEGYMESLEERSLKGQCVHDNLLPDKIIIDSNFWNSNDAFSREFIVFHELGHCYLDRNHRDELDNVGICVSIMHSGAVSCRENYNNETRKEYLDELFGMN